MTPVVNGGRPEPRFHDTSSSKVSQLTQSELSRNSPKRDGIQSLKMQQRSDRFFRVRPFMRHVIDEPLSAFAEAFRSIKVAADISGSHVIGITSTVPGEGKSTVSSNLAELIAHAGKRMIVLDGDLRNPALTRALAPNAKVGSAGGSQRAGRVGAGCLRRSGYRHALPSNGDELAMSSIQMRFWHRIPSRTWSTACVRIMTTFLSTCLRSLP